MKVKNLMITIVFSIFLLGISGLVSAAENEVVAVGCNPNMVNEHMQHCSAQLKEPVEGTEIVFKEAVTEQTIGSCQTNKMGYCHINPKFNGPAGNYYYVYAEIEAPRRGENTVYTRFRTYEERYMPVNLKTYEDSSFSNPSTNFNLEDEIYVTFVVYDTWERKLVSPRSGDFSENVYLRVNNAEPQFFEELASEEMNFRYKLNEVPKEDSFIGQGNIFVFAQGRCFEEGGQGSVEVTVN